MSQSATLRAMDSTLHAAFAAAGLADTGSYTGPSGGAAVSVRGYVDDEGIDALADFGQATGVRTVLNLLRADVAAPEPGATVVLDGQTYELESPVAQDASVSRWLVRHG